MQETPDYYNDTRMETIILSGLLGLISGLAVNYFSDVLPVTRKFSAPDCRSCGKVIPWREYLLHRRCPACGARPPAKKFAIYAVCILGMLSLAAYSPGRLPLLETWLLFSYLVLVGVIDLEYRLVLHPVSIAGAVLTFAAGAQLHGTLPTILGGAAGFGIMLALYYLGDLFARWMAKRRGQELDEVALGFGDVILSGVLGLLLGWPGITAGLVLAILIGGLASLIFLVAKAVTHSYQPFSAIPYAPFLILGAVILIFR